MTMQTIFIMLGKVFTVAETKKLICSWHIDKNWRNGLHTHIDVKSKQAEVYHHL